MTSSASRLGPEVAKNIKKIGKVQIPAKHKRNFEETHEILTEAYVTFLTNGYPKYPNPKMKQPTTKQLSEITAISTRTIDRHLAELDKDLNFTRRSSKYRLASDVIMKSWLKAAVKGNVAAGERFMQVSEQINFGSIVKIETGDLFPGPNLVKLGKEDLLAYKALVKKMAGKADGGSPQSAP